MDNNLKEIIQTKIEQTIKSISTHPRVKLTNFSEIQTKHTNYHTLLYHPVYENKTINFFNEEENTDFLVFENNKVYIDYSDNLFTFHKIDELEKLIEVDLDNQEILHSNLQMEVDDENLSNEIAKKVDLVTLNYFPLCLSHCNLTLCYDQNLSQVLSTEFVIQLLQIFSISKNSSLKCGYDSLGGGCLINHLHFEFLFLDDLKIDHLPIEGLERERIFTTNLKHLSDEEINLFDENVYVSMSHVKGNLPCWVLEAKESTLYDEVGTVISVGFQNSIAHLANFILTNLCDNELPHNLIIANEGRTIFIIPRRFDKEDFPVNTCWNDLAGLVTFRSKAAFDDMSQDELSAFLKEKVGMEKNEFDALSGKILTDLSSIYVTETNK